MPHDLTIATHEAAHAITRVDNALNAYDADEIAELIEADPEHPEAEAWNQLRDAVALLDAYVGRPVPATTDTPANR